MKTLFIISFFISISVFYNCNQISNNDTNHQVIKKEIITVLDSMNYYFEQRDYAKVRTYFFEDSLSVIRDGKFYSDGKKWLDWWQQRNKKRYTKIDSFKYDDYRIHIFSPTTAVFSASYSEIIHIVGRGPNRVHGAWTCAFQKHNGTWKIVSQHISHPRYRRLSDVLMPVIESQGVSAAIARYHELKKMKPGVYNFNDQALNRLGYELLTRKKYNAAIAIFKLNTEVFPECPNCFDSLGEAYYVTNQKEASITAYQKVIDLEPNGEKSDNARKMIERIKKEISKN